MAHGLQREPVLESCPDVAEGGQRLLVQTERLAWLVGAPADVAVNAGEVGLAVGHARRWPVQIDLAVGPRGARGSW